MLVEALSEPFATHELDFARRLTRAQITLGDPGTLCLAAFESFEPHVPWEPQFLDARADCYRRTGSPLAEKAREDVDRCAAVLKEMGATIVRGPEEGTWAPGYYSVLFEDPDGIRLEVNFVPGAGVLEPGTSFNADDGYTDRGR